MLRLVEWEESVPRRACRQGRIRQGGVESFVPGFGIDLYDLVRVQTLELS